MKEIKEFEYQDKKICANLIFADPDYNRPIKRSQIEEMLATYNPNITNDLKVSFRDEKYWIFDGNHTLKMLIEKAGTDKIYVKCRVYFGMTKEDEAYLFALQNGTSRKVTNNYQLRALNVAEEPEVMRFKDACSKAGASCNFRATNAPYHIKCYDAAYKIYQKRGEQHFIKTIATIIRIWNGSPDSLRKEIIQGMDFLLYAYPSIDTDRIKDKLREVSPKTIIADGKSDSVFKSYKRFTVQMLKYYNKNLGTNSVLYCNPKDIME